MRYVLIQIYNKERKVLVDDITLQEAILKAAQICWREKGFWFGAHIVELAENNHLIIKLSNTIHRQYRRR